MSYSRNRWYFRDISKIASFILIPGGAVFVFELKGLEPIGFFFCALGVGLFLLAQFLTPSDKQYDEGKNPFQFDSKEPKWKDFQDFLKEKVHFSSVAKQYPKEAAELFAAAEENAKWRYRSYQRMAVDDWSK